MNNCERIDQVFRALGEPTLTQSELLSALRQSFPTTKDFLIADHYENNKRDGAGNPIGGAGGPGSSCTYKPNGCMVRVAPRTYRLAQDSERGALHAKITSRRGEATVAARMHSTTWEAPIVLQMSDPLDAFSWSTLYQRYDDACKRSGKFNSGSHHLASVSPPAVKDRELYYWLVQIAALKEGKRPVLNRGWYEALLYWKLYSSTPDSSLTSWLQGFAVERLQQLLTCIPQTVSRQVTDIMDLVELIGRYQLPGMASSDALPVRTTFLHILYPTVVPIFDKMVLKAVGAWFDGANKNRDILRRYLPHAWMLADRYAQSQAGFVESPVRLIDMALWVERGA